MEQTQPTETYTLLLDTAENLFGTRGVPDVSMAEVASLAGVTHEELEASFATKDDLFLATCIRALRDYAAAILEAAEHCEGASGLETIRAMTRPNAAFALERPGFLLGFSELGMSYPVDDSRPLFAEYRVALNGCVAIWTSTVVRGHADGSIRTDLTPDQIIASMWGAFLGILKLQGQPTVPGSRVRSKEELASLVATVNVTLDSLRPRQE